MKFSCALGEITDAFAATSRIAGNATPLMSAAQLDLGPDALDITCVDMELAMTRRVPVQNTFGGEEGRILVAARPVADLLRKAAAQYKPDQIVEFNADDTNVTVRCGRYKFVYRLFNGDMLGVPNVPQGDTETASDLLIAAVNRVLPAASKDSSRPVLQGVNLLNQDGVLRLAATDSYRLAFAKVPGEAVNMFSNGKDITIPAKALNELAKSLSGDAETLRIGISDLAIRFQVGPTTIVTSLIAADYPQIDKLSHPAGETVLAYVNRDEFIDVIETVALIAESKGAGVPRRVSLHITAGQITVTAADQSVGAGDATIDADYDGPDTRIDFSVQYLIDGFRQMNGERAIIEFHPGDSIKPVHLRGDADIDDTYRYVVMPLRT